MQISKSDSGNIQENVSWCFQLTSINALRKFMTRKDLHAMAIMESWIHCLLVRTGESGVDQAASPRIAPGFTTQLLKYVHQMWFPMVPQISGANFLGNRLGHFQLRAVLRNSDGLLPSHN